MNARRFVATLALAAAVIGCTGTVPTPQPTATQQLATPTPPPVTFAPVTTAWVSGFEVTLERASADLDPKGGPVTVTLTIRNPGDSDATLDAPIHLTSGEVSFDLGHGSDLPEVAAGDQTQVSLEFEVVGQGTIDDGILRIGRPADHQAAIPLVPDPAALVSLEPRTTTLHGVGRAGSLHVATRGSLIRWDLPDWHDELPLETKAITLTYDVTNNGGFAGGIAFTADNVRLRLPNGKLVAPRSDGHSQSIVLIGPGRIVRGLFSRFEIPNATIGKLALIIRDGSSSKAIPFVIGP